MMHRLFVLATTLILPAVLVSCGASDPGAVLVGNTQTIVVEGEKCYNEAVAAERAGKTEKAIDLYDETATAYPFATNAGDARLRQAQLLDQIGETQDAFDAYDRFLQSYPTHAKYGQALKRMSEIAHDVVSGRIKASFLGIKRDVDLAQTVEMLGKIRGHAPKSDTAAKAQYDIGEIYLKNKRYREAVSAFRQLAADQPDHNLAPEALFRVGKILLEDAARGNQNQGNLDLSREAFNDYLMQYPGHSRNAEARKMISELDGREVQRSFDIAEFYLKTHQIGSARLYYKDVIKRSKSGKLHDAAQARLKEIGN